MFISSGACGEPPRTPIDLLRLRPRPPPSTRHRRASTGWRNSLRIASTTHTLEPDAVRLLKRLKAEADSPSVFVSERGGPMSVDAVQSIVKRAGQVAGLDFHVHPHMLRHACGFALANQEGTANDTRLIQQYLGHKDIKNTVIYTTLSQRRLSAVRVR
jgi:site-specific recombinase XerC